MNDVLAIFARYPRLGSVKTRLEAVLTRPQCLDLYTAFLLDTIDRTSRLKVPRRLFLTGCSDEEARRFAANVAAGSELQVELQSGADLGDRMWNAFASTSQVHPRVVFLGSDSPTLPLAYVADAFQALARREVAIGPALDGGYYLLGLSRPRAELFRGVNWGSDTVLKETLSKLSPDEYTLLPAWHDIDLPEDLPRLARDLKRRFDGFPERTQGVVESLRRDGGLRF